MFRSFYGKSIKNEDTRVLIDQIIVGTLIFIVASVVLVILAKIYLPRGMISTFDLSGLFVYGYFGVFILTLIGGTLVPIGTPAIVAGAAAMGMSEPLLVLVSTLGTTIGTLITYLLAYYLGTRYVKKKLSKGVYEDLTEWWNKSGFTLVIVFAAIPILPFDILALICGLFRFNFLYFILINLGANLFRAYIFVYIGFSAASWIGLI